MGMATVTSCPSYTLYYLHQVFKNRTSVRVTDWNRSVLRFCPPDMLHASDLRLRSNRVLKIADTLSTAATRAATIKVFLTEGLNSFMVARHLYLI
jgi:hypothetical protein